MTPATSADLAPLVSRSAAGSAIRDALRLYIGRGRRYSVKQVSNATGVKDRAIECAMADPDNSEWRPLAVDQLLSIALFLRGDFATEWLTLALLGAYDLPDDDGTPPGVLACDNSDDNAMLTRAAMDGVFDADERPTLKIVGTRMVSRGVKLVRMVA